MRYVDRYLWRTFWRGVTLCSSVAFLLAAQAEAEVMWWQVGDSLDASSLDDVIVTTFHEGDKSASELGVTEARIRVDGTDTYLLAMADPEGSFTFPAAIVPGEAYSSIVSPYASAEYSFVIELGNWDWDNGTWTMIAASSAASYSELKSLGHIVELSTIEASPPTTWSPTSYTVPEPSGGLLFIVGGGLLALRRRRRNR